MSWPDVKKINSDLHTPLNEGGVKIVKSIQKGVVTTFTVDQTISIPISTIDPDRSIVLISALTSGAASIVGGCYVTEKKENSISVTVWNKFSWQVVEFY